MLLVPYLVAAKLLQKPVLSASTKDNIEIRATYQNGKPTIFSSKKADLFIKMENILAKKKTEFANQTLHQTPDTWAFPTGAGGGAGELNVVPSQ